MNKKKLLIILALTRIPLMVYLVITIIFVPTIDSIEGKTITGAHRGASEDFEENTLEAFEKAVNDPKYQFIEFDIQYTLDKKIVVFHQNNMLRIPKKLVESNDLTYSELNEKFDFHMPEYHEVMDLIKTSKPINIEIKSHGNLQEDYELVDFIIADCKQRGVYNQLLLSSPSEEIIEYTEKNYPEVKTARIYWVTLYSIIPLDSTTTKFCEESSADYLSLHGYNLNNYERLVECKPDDKGLIFWYFTDEMFIVQPEDSECGEFWDC